MIIKELYRYRRENGGVTVSTQKPDGVECEITYRLIADNGMELVKGDVRTSCIDTDDKDGWTEEEMPEDEKPEDLRVE